MLNRFASDRHQRLYEQLAQARCAVHNHGVTAIITPFEDEVSFGVQIDDAPCCDDFATRIVDIVSQQGAES